MLFDFVFIIVVMDNDFVTEVEKGGLVADAFLDIHIQWLHMQIVKTENRAEVRYYLSDAYNDIRTLLTCQVVEFEVYLETLWQFWVIRLLQTRLHRKS